MCKPAEERRGKKRKKTKSTKHQFRFVLDKKKKLEENYAVSSMKDEITSCCCSSLASKRGEREAEKSERRKLSECEIETFFSDEKELFIVLRRAVAQNFSSPGITFPSPTPAWASLIFPLKAKSFPLEKRENLGLFLKHNGADESRSTIR